MKKRYLQIGDLKRNVLILATASFLGMAACDNKTQTEQTEDWSSGNETNANTYSKGVITELTEISPDNWKITDERPAGPGEVAAIVKHYDGKVDTLKGEALQKQMNQYAQANPNNHADRFGMMDVLMWSSIGYMAGRMMSPNPRYYANPSVMNRTSTWRNDISQQRSRGASFGGGTYRRSAPASGRTGVMSRRSGGFYS